MRVQVYDSDKPAIVNVAEAGEVTVWYNGNMIVIRKAADFTGLRVEFEGRIDLAPHPSQIYGDEDSES